LPKILCVDSGQPLQNVHRILEQAGCEVVPAASAQHALGVLARATIDGVVLTYSEGDTECLSLRNRIRHLEPQLPVLLLSAHGSAMHVSLQTLASYAREHPASERVLCAAN
jgi:DNA-binding NtrC family response regulator